MGKEILFSDIQADNTGYVILEQKECITLRPHGSWDNDKSRRPMNYHIPGCPTIPHSASLNLYGFKNCMVALYLDREVYGKFDFVHIWYCKSKPKSRFLRWIISKLPYWIALDVANQDAAFLRKTISKLSYWKARDVANLHATDEGFKIIAKNNKYAEFEISFAANSEKSVELTADDGTKLKVDTALKDTGIWYIYVH